MPGDLLAADFVQWEQYGVVAGHAKRTIRSRRELIARLSLAVDPYTASTAELAGWLAAQDVTTSSRATYRTHLYAWFTWLADTDRREDNPALRLPKIRVDRGRPRPLTYDEVARLFACCQDPRAWQSRAYLTLACYAGLRIHEIAKVRAEDIRGQTLRVKGKGGKVAVVPLHPKVAELAEKMPTEGLWFRSPKETGGHVHRTSVGIAIKRIMRRAGLPEEVTPHACRHFFGTSIYQATGDIYVTKEAMRHSNINSTLIYSQMPEDRVRDAIAKISA